MKKLFPLFYLIIAFNQVSAQLTPFEKSDGKESATFAQVNEFYKTLDAKSTRLWVKTMGPTDAGFPLQLVLLSNDGKFDPAQWRKANKTIVLVINGIHPGEPDGIDASMMLARNIVTGKSKLPNNICLAIIPVYNIGGALHRGSYWRANQNGPIAYGFRGNSQNLDLNRDFTKCDSREARSFTQIFHWLDPDIQIDNHVSDGADYQYTMTLLTTQPNKLGGDLGQWLKNNFEPSLYKTMSDKGWEMTPYVNFEGIDFKRGMTAFYDPPRYSSGYAAVWGTVAFVPETHMLKPFKARTLSTLAFMETVIEQGSAQNKTLKQHRQSLKIQIASTQKYPLSWVVDTTEYQLINFKGYEQSFITSGVSGKPRMYYNHGQPYSRLLKFYNHFVPNKYADAPRAYIIPQGWHRIIDLLKLNKVILNTLPKDSIMAVLAYRINNFTPSTSPYEGHFKLSNIQVDTLTEKIAFRKGDYVIKLNQPANRFLVEMLHPTGADSYLSWNYFDAVLQQKEGYSDYRWEETAAELLRTQPGLQQAFDAKNKSDAAFSSNPSMQLLFIYQQSPYYEQSHRRYPVFSLL